MKSIGYCRVSSAGQEEGTSLESQSARIRALAVAKDYTMLEVVQDVASGKSTARAGLERVMALVQSKSVDAVIVAKLDRLTRSLKDLMMLLEAFRKAGVALISLSESLDTETPVGRLLIGILGTVNQFERETIVERMADGRRCKRNKGGCIGHVPYGYHKIGTRKESILVEREDEQAIIRQMTAYRSTGFTLRGIADALNRAGMFTRSGALWRVPYVHSVLRSYATSK